MDAKEPNTDFGAGRLLLADSRLALIGLNVVRHWVLRHVFGASRAQANLLTFVVALSAADAGVRAARRIFRAPFHVSRTDATVGGFLVREAALGIAGPRSRELPLFGTLVTIAAITALAIPGLRQAVQTLHAAEQRLREQRISRYIAARRARE
jgi:hypothetical protein